jgi:hypothetical protein
LCWTVTVSYRFGDVGLGSDSPLNEPVQILPDLEHETAPFDQDINGNNICNSCGDPFDPSLTRFVPTATFIARKAMPFFDLQVALALMDHVNAAPFTVANFGTADTGQVYCFYYRPTGPYTSKAPYVFVECKIGVKPGVNPWSQRVVDGGRYGYTTLNGKVVKGRFCDSCGNPVDYDVRLNGKGLPIDPDVLVYTGAGGFSAPVAAPNIPAGLTLDPTLSGPNITQLIWNGVPQADFSAIQ